MNEPSHHIDPNDGATRGCNRPNDCRWGEPHEHYRTAEEARAAYENLMHPFAWPRFHKRAAGGKHVRELVQPIQR